MSAKVLPLRQPSPVLVPKLADLVARVRALAVESKNIHWDHPHIQLRMTQRGLNMRLVLETIRGGTPTEQPRVDPHGDWRIKLIRTVAGRTVQVVIAVKGDHLVVVIAI